MKQVRIQNRKAGFDYEFLEKFEAGLSLLGTEVKSIQEGQMNLAGAVVKVINGVPYLMGASVPAYQPMNAPQDYDPGRSRPLLLREHEIKKIMEHTKERGLTIVPISVYNKGPLIKLELAIARKKKKSDKREAIKQREVKREMGRRASR